MRIVIGVFLFQIGSFLHVKNILKGNNYANISYDEFENENQY